MKVASAGTGPSRWARQAASLLAQVRDDALRDDLRQRFDERAAICEIDGELSRTEAERIAFESLVQAIELSRHTFSGESREIYHQWAGQGGRYHRIEIQFGLAS